MMKMFDRTNIDFIGPRKICMVASVIVIALGLAAFTQRTRQGTMFNIDFTGGTLVTIRLNEDDPKVKALSESERAAYVRQTASVLPAVTVESLKVGEDRSVSRFNIRTTDQSIEHVKTEIVKAFGPALERVEMTVGEEKPIPGATPTTADAKAATPTIQARFAGGREYPLRFNTTSFNSTEAPAKVVSAAFARVLDNAKIASPTSRFEIVEGPAAGASPADGAGKTLVLRTDLEPEVAQAQLKTLAGVLQNDPNLLFERITNFGSTVAGETRTLALIATVASWLIIIVYLWFRFKSLVYGLAAVLAVVHDVLVTLGAVAVTYWLATIPGIREFLLLDQFKIDLPMIAAFLTLIGFSVNDTIVIFDRIREIKGKTPYLTAKMINDAINQTLSRTILTSFTAWLVVVILYILGGEGLHGFAFALVVGFLSGTYSTIYIATPILIDWTNQKPPAGVGRDKALATAR